MTETNGNLSGLGTVIVLGGIVILASNLDLIPGHIERYVLTWQALLIFVGAALLVSRGDRVPGLVLITTGIFFLLPDLADFGWIDPKVHWPMILIVVGLVLLPLVQLNNSKEKNKSKQG